MATFVAVHGAGTGGWLYDDVAKRLVAAGHEMHAPDLIGVGERATAAAAATDVSTHVQQVTGVVEALSGQVVLVGFSYGGYVITGVADAVPEQISRLVYLDAFVPQHGKSVFDQLPAPVRRAMQGAAAAHGDGWRIPPAPVAMVGGVGSLEPDVDPGHVDAVLARRGSHPIGTYRQVIEAAGPATRRPREFISCTDKPAGDPMLGVAAALRRAGWPVREIPTGHFAMLSMPTALAALLSAGTLDEWWPKGSEVDTSALRSRGDSTHVDLAAPELRTAAR